MKTNNELITKVGIWIIFSFILLLGGLAISISISKFFLFGYGVGLIVGAVIFIKLMKKELIRRKEK